MNGYGDILGRVFAGRRVVVVASPAGYGDRIADELEGLGATTFVLRPTGDAGRRRPGWSFRLPFSLSSEEELEAYHRLLLAPPADAVEAISRFDPGGTGVVLGSELVEAEEIAGRFYYARRLPAWRALDKVQVTAFFEEFGIAHPPYEVVDADHGELLAAHRRVRRRLGSVWAADASSGFSHEASHTRWVVEDGDAAAAAAFMAAHANEVRVTPPPPKGERPPCREWVRRAPQLWR